MTAEAQPSANREQSSSNLEALGHAGGRTTTVDPKLRGSGAIRLAAPRLVCSAKSTYKAVPQDGEKLRGKAWGVRRRARSMRAVVVSPAVV
jgi:hypothetical protein